MAVQSVCWRARSDLGVQVKTGRAFGPGKWERVSPRSDLPAESWIMVLTLLRITTAPL